MRLLSSWSFWIWLSVLIRKLSIVSSYPLILEVGVRDTKCFTFNVPPNDDAHMAFLALPGSMDSTVQEFYVDQMYQLSKNRKNPLDPLPRQFSDDPFSGAKDSEDVKYVATAIQKFMDQSKKRRSMMLKIKKPRDPLPVQHDDVPYFIPTIHNHVERYNKKNQKHKERRPQQRRHSAYDPDLDDYSVCFENKDNRPISMIYDMLLVSDFLLDEEEDGKTLTKEHLTPLETELAQSIHTANSIVSEMRFMEKRESRMRLTTTRINSRIRMFSYISLAVLLIITYLQVTYLKRYFKKKKLM